MDKVSSKVIHGPNGSKRLATYSCIQGRIVKQTIRDEEEYMDHLDKIIQRDFFPDLSLIKSKLNQPETSTINVGESEINKNCDAVHPSDLTLDKYLANNTTEDDASFSELIDEHERKKYIKLAPFFPSMTGSGSDLLNSNESNTLMLTDSSESIVQRRQSVTGNNAVHFNPEGASQTKEELLNHITNDRNVITTNTRFKHPFPVYSDKKRYIKQVLKSKLGHIGVDGTESPLTHGTPQVSGYKFLDSSPSPALSSLIHSPLMTWGELDATPSRLDETGLTPSVVSGSSAFRISSPSEREQLAYQLAEMAGRQRIRDKLEAVKRHIHPGVSTPTKSLLSPAARRLLRSSSSIINETASRPSTGLTPKGGLSPAVKTPLRRHPSELGVIRRPNSQLTENIRSKGGRNLAVELANTCDHGVDKDDSRLRASNTNSSLSSITDNLLNLKSNQNIF